jgi:hypothetical protein
MDEREKLRDYLKSHSSKIMGEYVLTLDVVEQIIIKDRLRVVEPLVKYRRRFTTELRLYDDAIDETLHNAGVVSN